MMQITDVQSKYVCSLDKVVSCIGHNSHFSERNKNKFVQISSP